MPSLRLVPYGPQAAAALRDAVIEAKRGDPLAPVTVAVPSNYAGLSLRRSLGSGGLSLAAVSGREGLINVRFLVLARIAELLGAPSLAAERRRPLTDPVRAEAIRTALSERPGVFHEVAEHRATERSLDATLRDLRQAAPASLDAIAAQGDRASTVVSLYRRVRELTSDYYDEEGLAEAAAQAARAGSPALRDVGHVILYLPRRLSPAERSLIEALAGEGGLTALVGLTGDAEADEPARRLASQLASACGLPEEPPTATPPAGTRIAAVTDAEEEVRFALRLVMERLAGGTPLHRIAVLYPTTQPYALLAHEQFRAAGVLYNGPAVRTLAQTLSGRTLLGLLHLREAGFRRDAVMDWLSAAPVLEQSGGHPAPAHRWDTLSRSAGVVGGAAQWRERLERYGRSLAEKRAALTDESDDWRRRRLDADIGHTERLARFVGELTTNLEPGGPWGWPQFAAWGRKLLARYLGGEGHLRDCPDDDRDKEVEAHRKVEAAVEALSTLSAVRPQTDEATFRRALERALDDDGTVGHFGKGVFIGRIRDATGTDFDLTLLLGMTEGIMPPRGRDDPLLPDRERSAAGDEMPLRTNRRAEDRRDYLAALAAAPERVLVYPRADLRGQRGKLPARWLLETASQLEERTVFSADLETLPSRPWLTKVPSFEAALAGGGVSPSEQEYGLRSLLHWRRAGRSAVEHYLAVETPVLRQGLSADRDRQGTGLTRWDGRLDGAAELTPSTEQPVSPTALQNYAACPRRYLLGHIFRIAETEKPEETLTLSPIDRGNLIHSALESFVRQTPSRASPDQPWTEAERSRLASIGEALCREAEATGVAGKALLWQLERARIQRDLAGFLDADERLRADHAVVPEEVEYAFGLAGGDEPPLIVKLESGDAVAFRGRIDRVDRAPDGSALVVLDYKSGSAGLYKGLERDPLKRGRLLQLPIYALAAQQRFGQAPVSGYYWFVTEQENFKTAGYPVDEGVLDAFRSALGVIVGGIGSGLFPARPGESNNERFANCQFCPYDRICPRDRAGAWRRKRGAEDLRSYIALAEPEQ